MKIHVSQGQVALIAESEGDENFLYVVATTFSEGGTLEAHPADSLSDAIQLEPATPVKT